MQDSGGSLHATRAGMESLCKEFGIDAAPSAPSNADIDTPQLPGSQAPTTMANIGRRARDGPEPAASSAGGLAAALRQHMSDNATKLTAIAQLQNGMRGSIADVQRNVEQTTTNALEHCLSVRGTSLALMSVSNRGSVCRDDASL